MALVTCAGINVVNVSGGGKGQRHFTFHCDLVKQSNLCVYSTRKIGQKGSNVTVLWYTSLSRTRPEIGSTEHNIQQNSSF